MRRALHTASCILIHVYIHKLYFDSNLGVANKKLMSSSKIINIKYNRCITNRVSTSCSDKETVGNSLKDLDGDQYETCAGLTLLFISNQSHIIIIIKYYPFNFIIRYFFIKK